MKAKPDPQYWQLPKVKSRDRFAKAERPTVSLTCGTCGEIFPPRPHTKRGATHNFCSQACRLDWTKRQFSNLYRYS